jgi:hypothetical protein
VPTTASGIPSGLPKAITPDTGDQPTPDDTTLIQIGFLEGYNYPFMVANDKAAAQVFKLLPRALTEGAGSVFANSKVIVKKLVPLDTRAALGYITTCAHVTYPSSMLDKLEVDIKLANSLLYRNQDILVFNLTAQINSAIPLQIGLFPDGSDNGNGGNGNGNGGSGNSDPFNNPQNNGNGSQKGTTAGIVTGAVFVAAAYGVVMFVIARRYKRKKQQHRRASSITSPADMQESGRSPALMGGALLSRDFTGSYGATAGTTSGTVGTAGTVSGLTSSGGGRNSHGSGRSGTNNSGRLISAPVAAENSLGWNWESHWWMTWSNQHNRYHIFFLLFKCFDTPLDERDIALLFWGFFLGVISQQVFSGCEDKRKYLLSPNQKPKTKSNDNYLSNNHKNHSIENGRRWFLQSKQQAIFRIFWTKLLTPASIPLIFPCHFIIYLPF